MAEKRTIQPVPDFDIVIFGATGDLGFRKIFPALYYRIKEGQVQAGSKIAAMVRSEEDKANFIEKLALSMTDRVHDIDPNILKDLLGRITIIPGDVNDINSFSELQQWFSNNNNDVRIYYLATPSHVFGAIAKMLHDLNLINEGSRIVLEKPLGKNQATSDEINGQILKYFTEHQIYRIDHYLGKETVQNLMVLRFSNYLFENSWNANHIESVQITAAEKLGVEQRGNYYNDYGALLDMVQNHLLQLLCLIAMEPPSSLTADEVRNEKHKVLKALRYYNSKTVKDAVVKGQYTRGNHDGQMLPSYLEDIEAYSSQTETFVALRAYVDNWRWKGVPFYLRTGKRMSDKYSEIVITFKAVPHNVFPEQKPIKPNKLIIRLQPEEKIEFIQTVKIPGPGGYRYKPVAMKLDYLSSFQGRLPDAYERLLMDVAKGDQTLFMSSQELSASWKWIESITSAWKAARVDSVHYSAGSDGPGDAVLLETTRWYKESSK